MNTHQVTNEEKTMKKRFNLFSRQILYINRAVMNLTFVFKTVFSAFRSVEL
jgi:hypothetical protein